MKASEKIDIVTELRDEVIRFAQAMEEKLQENDYKGGWKGCSAHYLIERMNQEVKELNTASTLGDKRREAVDVANFCMMIWDEER